MTTRFVRLLFLRSCVAILCFFATVTKVHATATRTACEIPQGVRTEISSRYHGTSLVTLADLSDYDKKLFRKDHGTRCLGLVKLDFYGDGTPTWVLALISVENARRKVLLVVVREQGNKWTTEMLDSADEVAVVWAEKPGEYKDVYGEKTIRALHPAIVFCGYGSWALLYAWTGKDVQKIWISD
jgi:hypothetical protein